MLTSLVQDGLDDVMTQRALHEFHAMQIFARGDETVG